MQIKDKVLLLVKAFDGEISGKTLLQKRLYFVGVLLGQADKLGYVPHYYGPYSQDVACATDLLDTLGFLEKRTLGFGEDKLGFELRRVDYRLTPDGNEIVKYLEKKDPSGTKKYLNACETLKGAGDLDYMSLSYAAKTSYLIHREKGWVSPEDIRSKAEYHNWKIPRRKLEQAINFLTKLKLVSSRPPA